PNGSLQLFIALFLVGRYASRSFLRFLLKPFVGSASRACEIITPRLRARDRFAGCRADILLATGCRKHHTTHYRTDDQLGLSTTATLRCLVAVSNGGI